MSEEKEESSFSVRDRRRVSPEGTETSTGDSTREKGIPPSTQSGRQEQQSTPKSSATASPKVTFSSFILSLSTQALMCLGEIPNPQDEKPVQDLPMAQQIIDIIGLLQEKTKGNLDDHEGRLIEHSLYDLRMRYVDKTRKPL